MIPLSKLPVQIKILGEGIADFIRQRDIVVKAEMTEEFHVIMSTVKREYEEREATLEGRITSCEEQYALMLETQRSEMQSALNLKQDEIHSVRRENSKLSETIEVMSVQSRQYASLVELLGREQAELTETKAKLHDANTRLSSLSEANQSYAKLFKDKDEKLHYLVEENEMLLSTTNKVTSDLESLRQEHDSLKTEFKDYMENKAAKITSLQDEVRNLKIQLSSAAHWGATLSGKVRDLNAKLAACDEVLISKQCESLLRMMGDLMSCLKLQESLASQLKEANSHLELSLSDTQRQKELDRLILPFMHAPKLTRP